MTTPKDGPIEKSGEWRKFCDWNGRNDTESSKVLYRPEYALMTGDTSCGILLAQVVYWFGYSKSGDLRAVLIDGKDEKLYHCETDADMGDQLGLTHDQVRRARRVLHELGLVDTRIGGFSGRKTVFYKLNSQEFAHDFRLVRKGQLDRRRHRTSQSEANNV